MDRSIRVSKKVEALEQGKIPGNVTCSVNFFVFRIKSKKVKVAGQWVCKRKSTMIQVRLLVGGIKSSQRTTGVSVADPDDFCHADLTVKDDPFGSARLQALRGDIFKTFNERLMGKRSLNASLILDIALGLASHDDEEHYVMGKTHYNQTVYDRTIKPKVPSAVGAIADYILLKEKLLGNGLSLLSLKRYQQYGRILTEFIVENYGKSSLLNSLTPAVEHDLFAFLKGKKKHVHNYSVKIIQFFKSILTYAHAHRWVDRNVMAAVRLTRHHKEVKTLAMSDLEKLSARDFIEQTLNQVRDVFLFCCYTGLAYTDVENLSREHLVVVDGVDCILKDRNKSGVQSFVPLFPEAIDILNRYEDHKLCQLKGVLLPVISNQKMNNALKVIGNIVGIRETLHTHLARKTFTMFSEERGFGLSHMAIMLGHTNTTMTERHYYQRRREPVIQQFKQIFGREDIKRLAS